ncbi:DUF4335 domain-containing protein [Spirulina sp. CS-785/01]|uniref:DUF4335 domain-containing protein n=1 Tax=Spirulina sp. CS-785/01 TaxID=3021716 RepID=UPI00232EB982|nr:DUF4335 domain-containing protein [Spirulina sp. CS-785/01]MDB9315839.1 DUF4335 domain-containing protein [Spirulina sp. CS-785/01]
MTIKRQYSLPNCRLVLEGLNENAVESEQGSQRPLMSILIQAECYFAGEEQRLAGGREFLENLVKAVSAYAQEFLSGVYHPIDPNEKGDVIQFLQGETPNIHHLVWQQKAIGEGIETVEKTVRLDLNTVQMFDLVEAVDQFFADHRTLPELTLNLTPVSRRHRTAEVPTSERVTPLLAGVGSLAIAAALLFFVPIPEVQEPEPFRQETSSETEGETDADRETETEPTPTPPSPEELEELLANAPAISDPTEVRYLQRYIFRDLNQNWDNREDLTQDLTYRVSATLDGSIVGYEPVEGTPENASEDTPLPDLTFAPTNSEIAQPEPITQYKVVFTDNGILQINPWAGYQGTADFGPEIEDPDTLQDLIPEVADTLREDWEGEAAEQGELIFRVGVTEDGEIADYEAQNQAAFGRVEDTPLPELVNPSAAGMGKEEGTVVPQEPLGQFRVVFQENGAVEVSPF